MDSATSNKCYLFMLVSLLFAVLDRPVSADTPYHHCPANESTMIATNGFLRNLEHLFTSLISSASPKSFIEGSFGNDEKVYGNFFCYITAETGTCQECASRAVHDIKERCPLSTDAIVWEDNCQLRYTNKGSTSVVTEFDTSQLQTNALNYSNPEVYRPVVLLNNLSKSAAFGGSYEATGQQPVQGNDTVYGLVQCTEDLSASDCFQCLQNSINDVLNCCYMYTGARFFRKGCCLRYELYPIPVYTFVSTPEVSNNSNSKIVVIVAAILAVVALLCCWFYFCVWRKGTTKDNLESRLNEMTSITTTSFFQRDISQIVEMKASDLPMISLKTIHEVTNNFSDANILGAGGFGPVYKGVLPDGKEVAVKRLSVVSEQGSEEFTNLVKLLDAQGRAQLDWRKRLNIITGISRGLLYLHQDSRLRIIHRDLKTSNVLLDENLNPKISDFGMARIFSGNVSEANTKIIVGTYGYMAPEYAMEGLYSVKSDVYSFGVLLMEILTGEKNALFHLTRLAPSLLAYAWQLWHEGKVNDLMDPLLAESCIKIEFVRFIHIALLCVQEDPNERPNMSAVVVMLGNEHISLCEPLRPAFSVGRFVAQSDDQPLHCSINGLTISSVSAS